MTFGDCILASKQLFYRVQVTEAILEGLLRTHGHLIFSGFRYFDFRPPIPSRYGSRHPDGALVAPGEREWWVVEVETHLHDVEAHVAPQLEALAEGIYGREALRYLARHGEIELDHYESVDAWNPSFLLVVDHATPYIRDAAALNGFELSEIGIYRTDAAEYALRVSGARPSLSSPRLPRGIDVELRDGGGITLLVPVAGRRFEGNEPFTLLIGTREVNVYATQAKDALAVPVGPDEIRLLAGDGEMFRITSSGALVPVIGP